MNSTKPPTPCQEPFTPCWCETRPNNPHCQGLAEAVSIQSDFLTIIFILAIFIYVFFIFKKTRL